ncbi:MAG: IS1182 family transposase [Chloroflexota bacterium]|nr:IS1182 family transposase [Chloroflexota bacterium]
MLRPQPLPPIPDDTARVARAAFRKGHPYLGLADHLGDLITDALFAPLFPHRGQPALAPWRLALATILQFAEGLSDVQAADAVRSRIDWKYLLRLDLTDAGFDASVLCEFRARLVAGEAEDLLLDTLLTWCREQGLLKARGKQRTDSTHVLAAIRALNRLELVSEAMRHALDSLAVAHPAWLRQRAAPEWAERYARRAEDARLPRSKEGREERALTIGRDGVALLTALRADGVPAWLRELPAVETLRRVWVQNYQLADDTVRWRGAADIPPAATFISSPHDQDAHFAKKETTQWVGYKVHLTEACDDDQPRLIVHVATTTGPTADDAVTPRIHADLQRRELLPSTHIVDTGFLDAALLVSSKEEYGVELLGPTRHDYQWQARERTGFAAEYFRIDWERQQALCPQGHTSLSWTPTIGRKQGEVIRIKFSTKDCGPCPCRPLCCRSQKRSPRRTLSVRPQADYVALHAARNHERTEEFATAYARRAGIEGTLSRGLRVCRLRRTRYTGQEHVHLGHVLTAVGLNFLRLGEWFSDAPRARMRRSPFATLIAGAPPT